MRTALSRTLGLAAAATLLLACANGDGYAPWLSTDDAGADDAAAAMRVDAAADLAQDAAHPPDAPPAADAAVADGSAADAGDSAAASPPPEAGSPACPPSCNYGCTGGACNGSCDGNDANCAGFPDTYCAWQGSWQCTKYAMRGEYCGTMYNPKCEPPLTCQNLDSNGHYSPQPTCEPP